MVQYHCVTYRVVWQWQSVVWWRQVKLSYGNARHSQEKHGIAWSSNGRAMLCSVLCGLVR